MSINPYIKVTVSVSGCLCVCVCVGECLSVPKILSNRLTDIVLVLVPAFHGPEKF